VVKNHLALNALLAAEVILCGVKILSIAWLAVAYSKKNKTTEFTKK
jgi:hypothetical protein